MLMVTMRVTDRDHQHSRGRTLTGRLLFVQIVPVYLVIWWLGRRHAHQKKMIMRDGGPALVASGFCSLIGAKYFGLSVFGKTTVARGSDAVGVALFMMAFGLVVLALHYFVFALIPSIWRFFRRESKTG